MNKITNSLLILYRYSFLFAVVLLMTACKPTPEPPPEPFKTTGQKTTVYGCEELKQRGGKC